MKPNKIRLRLWVKALRSGRYAQGQRNLLNYQGPDAPSKLCCLGIACEVYRQKTGKGKWIKYHSGNLDGFQIGKKPVITAFMPIEVTEWLGLEGYNNPPISPNIMASEANDQLEWSFEKIADKIEEYYDL